jgi:hypothetical protein
MRRQCRFRLYLDKDRRPAPTFHPRLEEIEARLLPGETVGLGLLASLGIFGGVLPLSGSRHENLSVPVSVLRGTEATGSTEPGTIGLASKSDQTGPLLQADRTSMRRGPVAVLDSESRNPQAGNLHAFGSDAVFGGNALSEDFTHDPLDASILFATTRPRNQPAAAPAAGSSSQHGAFSDFALAPLAGSPSSSTSGTVPAETTMGPAVVANPGSGRAALSGTGGFLHTERLLTRDQVGPSWSSYAHDPQHTAISDVASLPLTGIRWQTPVDLDPEYEDGDLYIHYGSPLVTQGNTVIVPVKTGSYDGFKVEGLDGATGTLKWSVTTDYSVPLSSWTPPLSPVLTPGNRLYIPGAGGTVYYMDNPDADNATINGRLAFYGLSNYDSSYDSKVKICTPLTSDSVGNIYFGFVVYGPTSLNLVSGIARMNPDGNGSWVSATGAAGDTAIRQVVFNCAPALSNDQSSLYVAVSSGSFGSGYLLRLDSGTLATTGEVFLVDPSSGAGALLPNEGTASPTVGSDGDVYFGVLENPFPFHYARGWLLHFSGDLVQTKLPGSFGWDDTASVVPASMVPSYTGSSPYLLMTKYNNYKGLGDGINKLAVLDPNAGMVDPLSGASVMQEVLTIAGVTPDPVLPWVREWCINTAAVDPATNSILANSEDGFLYRWDMITNTFTESLDLTTPTAEAYTPRVIGVDGTVNAIIYATLFAIGQPRE